MSTAAALRSASEQQRPRALKTASRKIFAKRRASQGRSAAYRLVASRENRCIYEKARQDRQSLQTDPIGYEDALNIHAYAFNDPMNGVDPMGQAVCVSGASRSDRRESGFSQAQCASIIKDAEVAIHRLNTATEQLRSLAAGLREGGRSELTNAQRSTLAQFERVYGRASATVANVDRIAGVAARASAFLASGETYFRRGAMRDHHYAAQVDGNRITLHGGYFENRHERGTGWINSTREERAGVLIHEGGHPAGLPGRPDHLGAYGAAGIVAWRNTYGTTGTMMLADALRCAVAPQSGNCP